MKWSKVLPLCLFVYLCVMAYVGRDALAAGSYLKYFGVIGISLVIIVALFFVLRKKEKMREESEEEAQYTTYAEEEKKQSESPVDKEK